MDKIDKYALIELIRENPCLWDQGSGSYHLKEMRTRKWKEVAEKMNLSCAEVKFTWQTLRTSFRREIRKHIMEPHKNHVNSPFFEQLLFLYEVTKISESKNNSNEEEQTKNTGEEIEDNRNICNNSSDTPLKRKVSNSAKKVKTKKFKLNPENVDIRILKKPVFRYKDIGTVKKPDLHHEDKSLYKKSDLCYEDVGLVKKSNLHYEDKGLFKKSDFCYEDVGLVEKPVLDYEDKGLFKKQDFCYENINLVKKPDECNNDDDYHFVLSLLPFLRKVPGDRKLGVRMSVIGTIEQELEMLENFTSDFYFAEYEHPASNSTSLDSEEPSFPMSTDANNVAAFVEIIE